MNNYQLDHVGIAVPSIATSAPIFCHITGLPLPQVEEIPHMEVNVVFIGSIELIEPRTSTSPISRHLERHGSSLHHIAFAVPDIRSSLKSLSDLGFHLIDEHPRDGARGHQVAFIHPKDTDGILTELVEHQDNAQ